MGKFVARTFVPGQSARLDVRAYDLAWEAWDDLLNDRLDTEAKAAGVYTSEYVFKLYSPAGDMNELAQPEAYDESGVFQVASCGLDFYKSNGTGVIWARTPVGVNSTADPADKGICFQVSWEETYVGL